MSPGRLLQTFLVGGTLIAIGGALSDAVTLTGLRPFAIVVLPLLYGAIVWMMILVHELGHAVLARLVGFRIHLFVVWPFLLRPVLRQLTIARGQNLKVPGLVLATPPGPDRERQWRRGRLPFYLGGVLGNWIFGGVLFGAASANIFGPYSGLLAAPIAVYSIVLGLANLVPSEHRKLVRSDGAKVWDILRGIRDPASDRVTFLVGLELDGVAAVNWDPNLVRAVEEDFMAGRSGEPALRLLMSYHAAKSDLRRCQALLDRYAERVQPLPEWLKIVKAFHDAWLDTKGPEAAALLADVDEAWRKGYFYWRAMAATKLALEDGLGTLEALNKAREETELPAIHKIMDEDEWGLLEDIGRRATLLLRPEPSALSAASDQCH